jgi:Fe-S cluster biogenesis protein NfuA
MTGHGGECRGAWFRMADGATPADEEMVGDQAAVLQVEAVLDEEIRPALGVHAGGIRIESVDGRRVSLDLLASCRACYFRKGCVVNLVLPTLEQRLGDRFSYDISGVGLTRRPG